MKKWLFLVFAAAVYLLLPERSLAVTAKPGPVEFTQPDGTKVTLLLKGDEHVHWATTVDGYTLLSDSTGAYVYASKNPAGIGFSNVRAHDPVQRGSSEKAFLGQLEKGIFFSKQQLGEMKRAVLLKSSDQSDATLSGGFPTTGTRKLLMILANFNNTSTTYTPSAFTNFMNQVNYNGTGSFRDYYLEVSYGQLIVNTTVTTWVTLPNTHDYYGPQGMWGKFAYDAIVAANNQAGVNFAEFDNNGDGVVDGVTIVHQGRGQEESGNISDIWSHSWDLGSAGYTAAQRTFDGVLVSAYTTEPEKMGTSSMVNIGVFCHEFGHNLGAPDFYDADYSTNGQYQGTGNWDLMASGSWNSNGIKPAHHTAWTKAYFGWITPQQLTTAQSVTLPNAEGNPVAYRYNTTTSNEYYLVENRQQTGFDVALPGHGMIIYHVDGNYISAHSGPNDVNCTSHQGLYPMAANSTTANGIMVSPGTINTTGCSWPGASLKTTFTDATIPAAKSWAGANTGLPLQNIAENNSTKEVSFCFISCSTTTPTLSVTPANQNVSSTAGTTTYTVTSNSAWTATSSQSWCTVTSSGTGNGTIYASYTANTSTTARSASITVTVNGLTPVVVTVSQAGTAPATILSVTPVRKKVSAAPGSTDFSVTCNTTWTATSNQGWCTVTPSGNGNGILTASFTANVWSSSRKAFITVSAPGTAAVTVTLTQSGNGPKLSATPATQDVPMNSGKTRIMISSDSAAWTASTNVSWLTPANAAGYGESPMDIDFSENLSGTDRIGTIQIVNEWDDSLTVTVHQSGAILGIDPDHSLVRISLYPNPTTGYFKITSSSTGEMGIQVMDMTGKTLLTRESVPAADLDFNLGYLPSGTYFVRIRQDKQVVVERLIIIK
ncbi:MAG: M6 family metalloprotease domain-containing protein [Syntrophothermus sp.]